MGTRRSRHNQGRKPEYKDHRTGFSSETIWDQPRSTAALTVEGILAKPAYEKGLLLNQRLNWQESDAEKLRILCDANADVQKSSVALGRDAKSITYKARDMGITLPPSWSLLLPKPKYIARPREQHVNIRYPFRIKVRDEHADLLAVNALVPKTIPDEMRGDICQEILLDIYQGKVNLATLQGANGKQLIREFLSRWRKANLERGGYGIMSFDPRDDERSYDEIAAARDWDWNQMNDARSNWEAQSMRFTPATQEDEVYERELQREHHHLVRNGATHSFDETAARVRDGIVEHKRTNHLADRIRIAQFIETCGFACDPKYRNPAFSGRHEYFNFATWKMIPTLMDSQYIKFTIPQSLLPAIEIRISDHPSNSDPDRIMLDTYKLGVEGVLRVLKELAANTGKYQNIHLRHNDFDEVLHEVEVV